MTKNERQQTIITLLEQKDFIGVVELSQRLNASTMTIRRDLERFEQAGIVRRVHGGAMLQKSETNIPLFLERFERCKAEKDAIGKRALSLISPESIVCFDAGTTTLSMTRHIPESLHFTVITTGVRTAIELSQWRNLDIIQVGGSLDHATLTIYNTLSVEFIRYFHADIAFLSTRAIDSTQGLFDHSLNLVEEKRALASIAKKVVVLADYTKFSKTSLCQSVPLTQIDTIITDNKVSNEHVKKLESAGVEVIVVDPDTL